MKLDLGLQEAIEQAVVEKLEELGFSSQAFVPEAYTLKEFAEAYRVSLGWLYLEWRRGSQNQAPAYYMCGNRRLISRASAQPWQKEREAEQQRSLAIRDGDEADHVPPVA
jgi:hypothetical protein